MCRCKKACFMLNFAQLQVWETFALQNLPPDSATNIRSCRRVDFKLTHHRSFLGWLLICYEKFCRAQQKHKVFLSSTVNVIYIYNNNNIIYFVAVATAILAVLSSLVKLQIICICSINGRLSCGLPCLMVLGIFGALTKLKSAANDLPYTSQVALCIIY